MLRLLISIHLAALGLLSSLERRLSENHDNERGSVTIEQVMWAAAVIVFVGIVVAAIRIFVTNESAKIR